MRVVHLPRPIHVVASAETEAKLRRKAQDHPSLPRALDHLLAELNTRRDGLPVAFDHPSGPGRDSSLLVHCGQWVARLFPTKEFRGSRRGYTIAGVDPLRLRDHHRLAQGCLLVRTPSWLRVPDIRQLGDHADSQWVRLLGEWSVLIREHAVVPPAALDLTAAQTGFLDRVSGVIDANERITGDAVRAEKPYPYRAVNPVGERRHGTHSFYEFVLTGRPPAEDTFVRIRGEEAQRGQITRIAGRSVTVRFDDPVDWDRIAKTGELEATPSTVVFRKQREAVAWLRDRLSRHTSLLDVLVDNRVRPLTPRPDHPTTELDESQLHAFRSALAVEDLMLILGPPGTGKTEVITQITRATAVSDTRRVLVTAHTNRAVDNVLGRLPRELTVVRVGNEGSVTEEGKPYLLETQARELRERIIGAVGATLDGLGDLDVAEKWAAELGDRTIVFGHAVTAEAGARVALDTARRVAGGPAQVTVDRLSVALRKGDRKIARTTRSVGRTTRWADRLGMFAGFWQRRLARLQERLRGLETGRAATAAELAGADRHLDEVTADVAAVRVARGELDVCASHMAQALDSALTAAHSVRAAVGNQEPPPQVRDAGDLSPLLSWLAEWIPLLRKRAALLSQWHGEVSGATGQLHPELVRYADVIAATSIGAASRSELSDVDFDLVVVDEAGQIGVADVLVPLVRGRRAVLVGDHQQLPPFLDSEVENWGKGIDDPAVRRLLSHSALETLVDRLPAANVVPLSYQRRMPLVIASFISRTFYRGGLHTAVERDHDDQLFRSAFAFVDTARLPETRRREQASRDRDRAQRGYHNPAEARLLAKLAAHYNRLGRDWAVIVPYRAQVKAVSKAVVELIGQPDKVRLNIGSVDSFQGGERDVILYGFTRSNSAGNIGFLTELRRANVAFTRAKRQLVLVGDLTTLTTARDEPFRELAVALRDHVAREGDIRQYEEIDAKL